MVGRQNHDLRVISTQYRLFEPLQRQVAFLAIELGQVLNKDGQASVGKAQLLDVALARPNLLVSTNSGPSGPTVVGLAIASRSSNQQ